MNSNADNPANNGPGVVQRGVAEVGDDSSSPGHLNASGDMRLCERPICELCGVGDFESLQRRPYSDPVIREYLEQAHQGRFPAALYIDRNIYELLRCRRCGFIWQRFRLADECVETLYEECRCNEEHFERIMGRDLGFYLTTAREVAHIPGLVGKSPAQIRVLDFGAGWGNWSRVAKAFNMCVEAVEVSPTRRAYLRDVLGIGTVDVFGDVGPYDFIYAQQVIEHLTDPRRFARRLSDVLRSGGYLFVCVPDVRDVNRLRRWPIPRMKDVHPLEHLNVFSPRTLRRLFEDCGLRIRAYTPPYVAAGLAGVIQQWAKRVARRVRPDWTTAQLFVKPNG
jgi:SAM-dependent methyltransferase